jgi:uncharacterized protein YcgI (DUF1989 family)
LLEVQEATPPGGFKRFPWRPSPINQAETAMSDPITIPARRGKAAFVRQGQTIKVINTHGQQVIDYWAFYRNNLAEFMSMERKAWGYLAQSF